MPRNPKTTGRNRKRHLRKRITLRKSTFAGHAMFTGGNFIASPDFMKMMKNQKTVGALSCKAPENDFQVSYLDVDMNTCLQSHPCKHTINVVFDNGSRISEIWSGRDIMAFLEQFKMKKLNPYQYYEHFAHYKKDLTDAYLEKRKKEIYQFVLKNKD
jgi:hypothetical protein